MLKKKSVKSHRERLNLVRKKFLDFKGKDFYMYCSNFASIYHDQLFPSHNLN